MRSVSPVCPNSLGSSCGAALCRELQRHMCTCVCVSRRGLEAKCRWSLASCSMSTLVCCGRRRKRSSRACLLADAVSTNGLSGWLARPRSERTGTGQALLKRHCCCGRCRALPTCASCCTRSLESCRASSSTQSIVRKPRGNQFACFENCSAALSRKRCCFVCTSAKACSDVEITYPLHLSRD